MAIILSVDEVDPTATLQMGSSSSDLMSSLRSFRELVIPAAPKTTVNQAIRPPPQRTSAQIDIPSGPKKSVPGLSNPISAPDVFNEPEDIAMDYMDVDPSPSQINPAAPEPDFQPGSSKKHSPDVLVL
ncbi:hypothetical protein PAXRUDRAFT_18017 [Paxillus rubicundulus Ve08.2h10]|uniref:Uncharacterized protein n=1 Tax=Paxillus rubicundulus Ve08.2h10 TaxID=930991 RepID=A0A0D0D8I4_9AGAM|nr:hypothetical protein PAXRUDRAFT_18017 [Paxillus rubicundulus Ve08.2h10]